MRANARNPLQRTIDAAARQAQSALSRGGFISRGISAAAPPRTTTTAGTDADGNVFTIHPFLLGADELGDAGATLSVEGDPKTYGY